MKDKIYVVEMSSDELGDMSIGYASSQAIANKMVASAESTEGFENCRFRAYQAPLNQLEINDNTISFMESKYREHPMTTEEIRANMDEDGYVHGNVLVYFSDMVGVDIEQFLDTSQKSWLVIPAYRILAIPWRASNRNKTQLF